MASSSAGEAHREARIDAKETAGFKIKMMKRLGFAGMLVAGFCLAGCGDGQGSNALMFEPCPPGQPLCRKVEGRSWSSMKEDLTFEDAKAYCSSIGGRLPTISELRALIVDCFSTQPKGTCRVTDTCTSHDTCWDHEFCVGCGDGGHSLFHDDNHFWTSARVADQPGEVWSVTFRYSSIDAMSSDYPISAYCTNP